MSTRNPQTISIIGAGLGGLILALTLHKHFPNLQPRIYELRDRDYDLGGAIMLSPNALRVLDHLGVYQDVKAMGFNFEDLTFMTEPEHKVTGKYYFGHEQVYGYKALRIQRNKLVGKLRSVVEERGIKIQYETKFSHVVRETESDITFALADGTEMSTTMLIGADGIHSKVRAYLLPDVVPQYSGFLGVTYAFPRKNLYVSQDGGADFPLPVSLHGDKGAFIMAPQTEDGEEIFAGRQYKHDVPSTRSTWDALLKNKAELVDMHQRDMNEWSPLVQSAQRVLSTPDAHSLSIWPFHTVPELDTWASAQGRVIILGDAAHAIPPTAGQGANQAFEDALSLGLLAAGMLQQPGESAKDWVSALGKWQAYRLDRVRKVLRLTMKMNYIRLPEQERKNVPEEMRWADDGSVAGKGQLGWLYDVDVEADVKALVEGLQG